MILKLLLILMVASTCQISNASELDSSVSYEDLNNEVGNLLERVEDLERDAQNFNGRQKKLLAYLCAFEVGGKTFEAKHPRQRPAKWMALGQCNRSKNKGEECRFQGCKVVRRN